MKKKRKWKRFLPIYLMMLPGLIYLIINNYIPMFGVIIAFKRMNFTKGILGSSWCGLDNFKYLFASRDAWTITRNTIGYNLIFIIVGAILAVTLAILLNEIRNKVASRLYQTTILLPYLMSWVIVGYLGYAFLGSDAGLINGILKKLGLSKIDWYNTKTYWPYILILVHFWKTMGYSMIIYFSSIVGFNADYYEAAALDGASKWQQIRHITIPLLKPTIITMLIINLGNVFRSDFGLFYQLPRNSGALYDVTRTLDVYVYNALLKNNDFGMSSAASFYQSIVGFIFVMAANGIVKRWSKENALF